MNGHLALPLGEDLSEVVEAFREVDEDFSEEVCCREERMAEHFVLAPSTVNQSISFISSQGHRYLINTMNTNNFLKYIQK